MELKQNAKLSPARLALRRPHRFGNETFIEVLAPAIADVDDYIPAAGVDISGIGVEGNALTGHCLWCLRASQHTDVSCLRILTSI